MGAQQRKQDALRNLPVTPVNGHAVADGILTFIVAQAQEKNVVRKAEGIGISGAQGRVGSGELHPDLGNKPHRRRHRRNAEGEQIGLTRWPLNQTRRACRRSSMIGSVACARRSTGWKASRRRRRRRSCEAVLAAQRKLGRTSVGRDRKTNLMASDSFLSARQIRSPASRGPRRYWPSCARSSAHRSSWWSRRRSPRSCDSACPRAPGEPRTARPCRHLRRTDSRPGSRATAT